MQENQGLSFQMLKDVEVKELKPEKELHLEKELNPEKELNLEKELDLEKELNPEKELEPEKDKLVASRSTCLMSSVPGRICP